MSAALLLSLLVQALPPVVVQGNVVLPGEVYRTVLTLAGTSSTSSTTPARPRWLELAKAHPEQASARVRTVILDFLRASGYDLARVEAQVTENGVHLEIDEGRLDKIIFLREGTFSNIELKFALYLPGEVFNRPLLEEKLKALIQDSNIKEAHYELVETQPVEHAGIQVDEPRLIRGLRLLNPGSHHELHIRLERGIPKAGLRLGVGLAGSDGLYAKGAYRAGDVITRGDRLELRTSVGFYLGSEIDSDRNPLGISRLHGGARWSPLSFGSDDVRTFAVVDANLYGRRRNDLQILNYYYTALSAGLLFEAKIYKSVTLSVGGGAQQRLLSGVDDGGMTIRALEVTPDSELRFFIALGAEFVFNPKEIRADRQHRLILDGRYLGASPEEGSSAITKARIEYEYTLTLGWDEFRMGLNAAHFFGRLPFYEELSIGDGFLRSGFATQIWVRRAAAAHLEYRVSLSRDTLKMSVFNDFAVYGQLGADREQLGYAVADTFGAGVHVLLFDAFQINTYLGLTVDQHLGLDLGVKAELTRAF